MPTATLTPISLLRRLFDELHRALLTQLESAGLAAPICALILRRFRHFADNFLYFTIHPDRCPPPRPPRPSRPATPRPNHHQANHPANSPRPAQQISREPLMPRKTHGWLCRLLPGGQLGGYAFQLERHLHTPEFIDLFTDYPDLGRHLHSLCRMLGIKRPRPATPHHQAALPASANPAPEPAPESVPEPACNTPSNPLRISPAPIAPPQPSVAPYFQKP